MNFSLSSLTPDIHETCSDGELENTVTAAIQRGERRSNIRVLMRELLKEIKSLKNQYVNLVDKSLM